ncbi:MAG: hypothetical protein EXS01_05965 [Phycisphaerales bacterium]|nr:hypothetical protein [Phycisphaerales bacterium]
MTTTPPTFASLMPSSVEPPVWIKRLGGVAVAFGILGILVGLCGIGSAIFMDKLAGLIPINAGRGSGPSLVEVMAATSKYQALALTNGVLSMAVAGILLYGGIKLLQQRAKCRSILLNWAVLKFVVAISGTWIAYLSQRAQMEALPGGINPMFSAESWELLQNILLGSMFVWLIALPIFVIVWFGRSKIKSQIATWA